MTTDKTISSYFNPCSMAHDAMTNFKGLSCLKQMGIGAVVTLLAISILFAPFAVPVFRILNERCQVQTKLGPTSQKTQHISESIIPKKEQPTPQVTPTPLSTPEPKMASAPFAPQMTLDRNTIYTFTEEAIRTPLEKGGVVESQYIEMLITLITPQPLCGVRIKQVLYEVVKSSDERQFKGNKEAQQNPAQTDRRKAKVEQLESLLAQCAKKSTGPKVDLNSAPLSSTPQPTTIKPEKETTPEVTPTLLSTSEPTKAPEPVAPQKQLDEDTLYTFTKGEVVVDLASSGLKQEQIVEIADNLSRPALCMGVSGAIIKRMLIAHLRQFEISPQFKLFYGDEYSMNFDLMSELAVASREAAANRLSNLLAQHAMPVKSK